jgi:hypothetical protein
MRLVPSIALLLCACSVAQRARPAQPSTADDPPMSPAVVSALTPVTQASHATSPPRALTPADIAARAFPSIVTIRTADSLGTGFVVRPDGWIATNLHVIVGGSRVSVTFRDGRELDVVDVIATSTDHDLALVRVQASDLPTLPLGDSDAIRPGDPIVAIGNPMGLENTVSNGLVSARRQVDEGDNAFEVLQVSAPIAPGSSGGPLFNERGEVIGIATAILESGQNLNFGVPATYLSSLMRQPSPVGFREFAKRFAQARHPAAPRTRRSVPRHPVTILDGCSIETQQLVAKMLGEAIEVGAPIYNEGKAAACYHVYDGAASDLLRKLPRTCKGPARALADAQKRAMSLPDSSAKAWTMRDAFDGLLEVIVRKHQR